MEKLSRYTFLILLVLGLLFEVAIWKVSGFSDVRPGLGDFFLYFGIAFLVYVMALVFVAGFWHRTFFSPELLIGFGILFRMTMLFSAPVFSDDVCRYVWDGRVANAGINPYQFAPDSENLHGLRDETIYPHVNHRDVNTIYPPVLQYVFRLTTMISESVTVMKAVMTLFDIALMILLFAMLRTADRPRGWIVAYAWNPLIILEVAGNGHADVIGAFFLMLGLWFALKDKPIHAISALTLSFFSKFMAFATMPFVEDFRSRLKTWAYLALAVALGTVVLYLPFLDAGANLWKGLTTYVADWEFNAFIYKYVHKYFQSLWPVTEHAIPWMGLTIDDLAKFATKMSLFGAGSILFLGLLIVHFRKPYRGQKSGLLGFSFILTSAILLFSPTLHPWYIIWVIPFLCFFPNAAWVLFSGMVMLSYSVLPEYHRTGVWKEDMEIVNWQYLPFFGILTVLWAYKTIKKIRSHPEENN